MMSFFEELTKKGSEKGVRALFSGDHNASNRDEKRALTPFSHTEDK